MGNSSPRLSQKPNAFDILPRELHEVIGGYIIGSKPVRIDQILGYVLVSKYWSQTVFSGPIRLVAFNKHRVSIDVLERISSFDRLSFCMDLRSCQRLGIDEEFLGIMTYHNIYELDLRGITFSYDIEPDLGHLTALRRLAICQTSDRPVASYIFVSKLTKLNSLIIQQEFGDHTLPYKLDLNNFSTLTNLKELAIHPYTEVCTIVEPVSKLTSLKALLLYCGDSRFDQVLNNTPAFEISNLTSLTQLNTLVLEYSTYRDLSDETISSYSSVKWQTNLQRIYHKMAKSIQNNPLWMRMPDKKFQLGDTLVVDTFNSYSKVGFY